MLRQWAMGRGIRIAPGSRPLGLRSPEWRVADRGRSPGMGEGHPHPLELWVTVAFVRTYWTRATLTHTDATPPAQSRPRELPYLTGMALEQHYSSPIRETRRV